MTVLTAIQAACVKLAIDPIPSAVYSATTRDMVEMKAMANEVARQIAEAHDWSMLKGFHTITGDGSDTDFALPSDYDRMVKDARLWSSTNTGIPLEQVKSMDDWLAYDLQSFFPSYGAWIIFGGQINIKPARAVGETVKFPYVGNKIVTAADTSTKAAFTADTDVFRLPERLLTLGIIWNWKSAKAIDYAEEMASYNDALSEAVSKDRGPSIIVVGRQRVSGGNPSYPWPITP